MTRRFTAVVFNATVLQRHTMENVGSFWGSIYQINPIFGFVLCLDDKMKCII